MDPHFLQFCEQHGIEPNDERYVFWLAGRHTEQSPVGYAYLLDGHCISVIDAPKDGTVPLYTRPVSSHRAPLDERIIRHAWSNYDGDIVGFARWLEKHLRGI
jgi:hypothetical protein